MFDAFVWTVIVYHLLFVFSFAFQSSIQFKLRTLLDSGFRGWKEHIADFNRIIVNQKTVFRWIIDETLCNSCAVETEHKIKNFCVNELFSFIYYTIICWLMIHLNDAEIIWYTYKQSCHRFGNSKFVFSLYYSEDRNRKKFAFREKKNKLNYWLHEFHGL